MEEKDLIPVPEAARRAGVARNTMRLAAKTGKIKATRIGRDWLIYSHDIERWKKEVYRPEKALRHPAKPENE
jgi:excisionase family DNA binding protein